MTTISNNTKEKKNFKIVKKTIEMDNDMVHFIENYILDSFDDVKIKFKDEMELANSLKEKLEIKYGAKDVCWHVIVGKNFGACATYQDKYMLYLYIGQIGFLVFATPNV